MFARVWNGLNVLVQRHPGMFVLCVAVFARVLVAVALNRYLAGIPGRDYLIEGDADGYWVLALKLLQGNDFSLYEPPRYVLRMPGFPAVLALLISICGESQEAVRYGLAVLTSLAVLPAVWLGRGWHSPVAGVWAGLVIALMPVYVGFSVTILTECLFAAIILWDVWACARWLEALQRESTTSLSVWGWGALSGLLAGLAVYFRPSWLLFPAVLLPALAGILWSNRRASGRGLASWGVVCVCLILPLLPWGWRNQQVTGHFVLTTLWMGPSLYDGLRPGADGDSDMTFFEEENVLARMSEYEMNRHYKDRAWSFVREHPGESLRLAGIKLWRFWKPWPNAEQFRHPVLGLMVASGFLFLLVSAVWGSWCMRKELWLVFLCWAPILYFTGIHLFFVSSLRYRLPAEFPLAVLAGIGLQSWLSRTPSVQGEPVRSSSPSASEESGLR